MVLKTMQGKKEVGDGGLRGVCAGKGWPDDVD